MVSRKRMEYSKDGGGKFIVEACQRNASNAILIVTVTAVQNRRKKKEGAQKRKNAHTAAPREAAEERNSTQKNLSPMLPSVLYKRDAVSSCSRQLPENDALVPLQAQHVDVPPW